MKIDLKMLKVFEFDSRTNEWIPDTLECKWLEKLLDIYPEKYE